MNNKQTETINQLSINVKQKLFESIESGKPIPQELESMVEDKWVLLMKRLYTDNRTMYKYLKRNILSKQEESDFFKAYNAVKDDDPYEVNGDEIILEEQETIESHLLRKPLNKLIYTYQSGDKDLLQSASDVSRAIKYISTENLELMDIDWTDNVNKANVGRLLVEAETESLDRIRGRRPYLTFVDAYADDGNIQEVYNFVMSIPINKEYKGEAEIAEMAINIMNRNPFKIPDAVTSRISIEELRKIKKLVKLEYQDSSRWDEADVDRAYITLGRIIGLFTADPGKFHVETQDTVLKIQKYAKLIKTKSQNGSEPVEVVENGGYYGIYQNLKELIRDFLTQSDIEVAEEVMKF